MNNKNLLKKLRSRIDEDYPGIIDKVILYGSRIRNANKKASDYDIIIILKNNFDWKLEKAIQDLCWEIDYEHDILTDVKIYSAEDLKTIRGKQLFILDALENGIAV